jgi:hypothetical protein
MRSLRFIYKKIFIPIILVFMVITFIWIVNAQSKYMLDSNSSATLQSTKHNCVPTPIRPAAIDLKGQIAPPPTPITSTASNASTSSPSAIDKPFVISKINDLATDVPDQIKTYVYVMHCDGSIELFKVKSSGDMNKDVPLFPDDFVLDWIPPASLMGSRPPSITNTQIPTAVGYPPPATP